MRYTFHGGGPCDGALNGAVMPGRLEAREGGTPVFTHAACEWMEEKGWRNDPRNQHRKVPEDDFPAAKMRRRFPVSQGQDVVEETRQNAIYIIGASVHGQGHARHRQPDPAAVPDDRTSASRHIRMFAPSEDT